MKRRKLKNPHTTLTGILIIIGMVAGMIFVWFKVFTFTEFCTGFVLVLGALVANGLIRAQDSQKKDNDTLSPRS